MSIIFIFFIVEKQNLLSELDFKQKQQKLHSVYWKVVHPTVVVYTDHILCIALTRDIRTMRVIYVRTPNVKNMCAKRR